jgi:hypothetical protein
MVFCVTSLTPPTSVLRLADTHGSWHVELYALQGSSVTSCNELARFHRCQTLLNRHTPRLILARHSHNIDSCHRESQG